MGVLFGSLSGQVPDYYEPQNKYEKKIGHKVDNATFDKIVNVSSSSGLAKSGTSVFDPCLCEIMYLWYSKQGDCVIDPFAGGSVRGAVASELDRKYCGIELRDKQVEANIKQAEKICRGEKPRWIIGDSNVVLDGIKDKYDFMLTCPPYGNLEVYSDLKDDISNMSDEQFDEIYTSIIGKSIDKIKDDRFAVIVVSNYRDKQGFVRDLVGITVRACEKAGARYYNDFILATPPWSLAIRIKNQFLKSRKMGRMHQYVLVFCKGDPYKATERLGDVFLPDIEDSQTNQDEMGE